MSNPPHWVHVAPATIGSRIGTHASMTFLHRPGRRDACRLGAGVAQVYSSRDGFIERSCLLFNAGVAFHQSSLTIGDDSPKDRRGTPPPNGRLTIWKGRS